MTTVALGILCHNRPAELEAALQSAFAQGFDETIVIDMASDPPIEVHGDVRWVRLEDNIGPVGRNHLVAISTSDAVAFLDDDATFISEGVADRLRRHFADPSLGAVAFAISRDDGTVESSEWPFRGQPIDTPKSRPCAYFVGAGHAVRRTAWLDSGGLDERFFYSTEEVDLALALARDGFRCWFDADIHVVHRPSAHGRSSPAAVVGHRLRNRILVARRHLPALIAMIHIGAWGLRTLVEALRARDARPWLRAWGEGLRGPVARSPLSWMQCFRVQQLGGRVFW